MNSESEYVGPRPPVPARVMTLFDVDGAVIGVLAVDAFTEYPDFLDELAADAEAETELTFRTDGGIRQYFLTISTVSTANALATRMSASIDLPFCET